jgi:hypothetical protein
MMTVMRSSPRERAPPPRRRSASRAPRPRAAAVSTLDAPVSDDTEEKSEGEREAVPEEEAAEGESTAGEAASEAAGAPAPRRLTPATPASPDAFARAPPSSPRYRLESEGRVASEDGRFVPAWRWDAAARRASPPRGAAPSASLAVARRVAAARAAALMPGQTFSTWSIASRAISAGGTARDALVPERAAGSGEEGAGGAAAGGAAAGGAAAGGGPADGCSSARGASARGTATEAQSSDATVTWSVVVAPAAVGLPSPRGRGGGKPDVPGPAAREPLESPAAAVAAESTPSIALPTLGASAPPGGGKREASRARSIAAKASEASRRVGGISGRAAAIHSPSYSRRRTGIEIKLLL